MHLLAWRSQSSSTTFFGNDVLLPPHRYALMSVYAVDAKVNWNNSPTLSHSPDDMEMCSLKVLQPEGSPSRTLLKLMGERGCTTGHLMDYLQTVGNAEALQCLKPPGTLPISTQGWFFPVLNLVQKREFSLSCSLTDSGSAPVCRDPVGPQFASQLLRCGQISRAVPVVQRQGRGELRSAFQ